MGTLRAQAISQEEVMHLMETFKILCMTRVCPAIGTHSRVQRDPWQTTSSVDQSGLPPETAGAILRR